MKERKTPGATPSRTPKGFRALFSLWEGGCRKSSPQKGTQNRVASSMLPSAAYDPYTRCAGQNDAAQANATQALPDPSPLKTSTTSSIVPSDAKTPEMPGGGADAGASPAPPMLSGPQVEDSTWGSNWESSDPATGGLGCMDVDGHDEVSCLCSFAPELRRAALARA